MDVTTLTVLMQQQGIRRVRVISGEEAWCWQQALSWQQRLPGDWVQVSERPPSEASPAFSPSTSKSLLGREFQHAIFDACHGFHAEAFAVLAGTLRAGSWLQLLVPPWLAWPHQPDADSLRWSEQASAIATPHFIRHFQQALSDGELLLHRQGEQPMAPGWLPRPRWHCHAPQQQQAILQQLLNLPPSVAVLTAARGRGKSALAGMLAQQQPCIITAPAKVSTAVLASFAGEHFHFQAPDALMAAETVKAEWLIVDEAAAIPAPLLARLIARFRRVLLVTTVQGYEGTGRGFLLKFCASIPDVRYFTLDEPLRWAREDPLEKLVDESLLFSEPAPAEAGHSWQCARLLQHAWQNKPGLMSNLYRLLTSAHYRTSPLDLRRMMDAPGMDFIALHQQDRVAGALWLVREGNLPAGLAQAVWAGFRRPRGNLVAQSLAAHGNCAEAATLTSLRISRIAIEASLRRKGQGSRLLQAAQHAATDVDFLSVSFGFTVELWRFWQRNGYTLVRIGSHLEASSGCYTAMALRPVTEAGNRMMQRAEQRFLRDWPLLREWIAIDLPHNRMADLCFNDDDWREVAGFAFASRPFEVSLAALTRLLHHSSLPLAALRARIIQRQPVSDIVAANGLPGAKGLLRQWRQEAAAALRQFDPQQADSEQNRLQALQ